jgi:hypothetical protein
MRRTAKVENCISKHTPRLGEIMQTKSIVEAMRMLSGFSISFKSMLTRFTPRHT